MALESSAMLNCMEFAIAGLWELVLGLFFSSFFIFLGAVFKSRQPKRSLHASQFFFSFGFSRTVLYSFHSSIDLGGEDAQRENDK